MNTDLRIDQKILDSFSPPPKNPTLPPGHPLPQLLLFPLLKLWEVSLTESLAGGPLGEMPFRGRASDASSSPTSMGPREKQEEEGEEGWGRRTTAWCMCLGCAFQRVRISPVTSTLHVNNKNWQGYTKTAQNKLFKAAGGQKVNRRSLDNRGQACK